MAPRHGGPRRPPEDGAPPRRRPAGVPPAGRPVPPVPRQSRLLALLFRYRPRSHARALTAGLCLGLLWWFAVSLTLLPLLDGRRPAWDMTAFGEQLPKLLALALFSSLAGLLFHEAAVRHLDGGRGGAPGAPSPARPPVRVVILGGGFGGVTVARRLERLLPRVPDLEVVIVSRSNALLFTPMLAEVASRSLEPNHVGVSVRAACPGTRFRLAEVERVDTAAQLVHLRARGATLTESLPYDHLVLALGAVPNYLNLPGVRANSVPLKTISDAITLRNHVIARLEHADVQRDPRERRRELTFVVAGGGFAGVEIMAGLCDLVRSVRRYFPSLTGEEAKFVLVHGRDRILPETNPELGDYARRKLQDRGVHFLLDTRVESATADAIALSTGKQLPTRTLVWAAGNRPAPVLATLPFEHNGAGAVVADASLRVAGTTNVWAVGDCAEIPDASNHGRPCPPTAQHAVRQARTVADNLVRVLEGGRPKPFRFRTVGFLATVGHHRAVADIRGMRFSGVLAWLMWRGIYLSKLPGIEKRVRVLIDWAISPFFARDIALTSTDPTPPSARPGRRPAQRGPGQIV